MTMFGRSWNGRWNGRPSFVSGYVHHVSRAAKPRTGFEMFEQIVFDDQLAAGDVHEDRVLLHARQEATVH